MSGKLVPMTEALSNDIKRSVGDPELDTSKLQVFETIALSTRPIKRNWGMYNGARPSVSLLKEMADFISKEGNAVPLQIMHNNEVLPIGRVVGGQVVDNGLGDSELRAPFYVSPNREDLIVDIKNSIIDEVSVGLSTKHAFCSECGVDFLGDTPDIVAILSGECPNGHIMGQDGAHVNLVGLQDWYELSLVGRGASTKAKILSRVKQSTGKDSFKKLAASGAPLDAMILTANFKLEEANSSNNTGDPEMDFKELMASLTAKTDENAVLKANEIQSKNSIEALNKSVSDLTASIAEKDATIAELKASNKDEDKEKLIASGKEAEKKLGDAAEKLRSHAKAALIASGATETDLDALDAVQLVELIEAKGLKVHQAVGAVSDGSKKDVAADNAAVVSFRNEAFKTNRN